MYKAAEVEDTVGRRDVSLWRCLGLVGVRPRGGGVSTPVCCFDVVGGLSQEGQEWRRVGADVETKAVAGGGSGPPVPVWTGTHLDQLFSSV